MTDQPAGNGVGLKWGDKALQIAGTNTIMVVLLLANLAGLVYGFRELRKDVQGQFTQAQIDRERLLTELGTQYQAAVVRFGLLEQTLTRQNQIANCIGRLSESDMRTLRQQLYEARRGDTAA